MASELNGPHRLAIDVMHELEKVCVEAAKIGGQILLNWRGRFAVREKARFDLVTEADVAAQEAIRSHLLEAFPDHGFLGEEDSSHPPRPASGSGQGYCWIVDPLDGTTNYVHGLKNYCTSVALESENRVIVAAVFDPEANECYTAMLGQGAFLNQDRLKTTPVCTLKEALVAGSFPPFVQRDSVDVQTFLQFLERSQSIRRLGSAALNLCYLAAGRLDAYWAMHLKSWDMAAGMLIVQEAGGIVTAPDGGPVQLHCPQLVASATRPLHDEILTIIG